MDRPGIHSAPTAKRPDAERAEGEGAAEQPAPKQLKIEVTPAALEQIWKLSLKRRAEGKPLEGLRIGLRGGGCDGFSYVFEWADQPATARDRVFEFAAPSGEAGTIRILIDPKSLIYLQGTTLNFVTGLMGHGFKFENPNVKGSCGCGESVQF